MFFKYIFVVCFAIGTWGQAINNKKFPDNFFLGTASAAYQIEGAWNEDGKGDNIWDRVCHSVPSPIYNSETADIACDSYHKFKEDVALIKDLGSTVYRFSISWSRILPTGFLNNINQAGITYYKNLINELRKNGIEPLVTIFHWDLPQPLQDIGGFPNELIIERYVEYAKVLFDNLGNDVKYWLTFNEPKQTCQGGYGIGSKAPMIKSPGIGEYLCTHNVIKAHAAAWHLYDKEYRKIQQGQVGITIDTMWMEPESNSTADIEAAERFRQFTFGWYANPIIIGDYPSQMKKYVAERSAKQGFSKSRLPVFTEEQIENIKGTYDFLGLNYYTSYLIRNRVDNEKTEVSWESDSEIVGHFKEDWQMTPSDWLRITPWGLGKLLNWLKVTYGDVPIFITENGVSDDGSSLEDDTRIYYYQTHLSNIRDALDNGVNVIGYTAWSLIDNFEWLAGYSERFGIISVDFNDANRTRTPKKSAGFIKKFFNTRCLVDECVEA